MDEIKTLEIEEFFFLIFFPVEGFFGSNSLSNEKAKCERFFSGWNFGLLVGQGAVHLGN